MKTAELRKLDIEKLNSTLAELRNKDRELRFSIANNQLKNIKEAHTVKKNIAQILTVLNEKRLSVNVSENNINQIAENK